MLTTQRLTTNDWQKYREIRLQALAEAPSSFSSTVEKEQQFSDEQWVARLKNEQAATFVAVSREGQYLGLAVGAPYEDGAGLFSMWVHPDSRGQGTGAALVECVIQWAKQTGHPKILLDVGAPNEAAIKLYESKGFVMNGNTGTLERPDGNICEHQMELDLGESTAR